MTHFFFVFRLATLFLLLSQSGSLLAQNQSGESGKQRSKIAFQLPETGLITEGIAYDAQTETFFIGSVHERKIISYTAKNGAKQFSQPGDSLWGVFGLTVDVARRQLWACSSTLPQAKEITGNANGRTALVKYDLETSRLLNIYPLPADGKPHLFGDLTIAKNETVYATDSRSPWIYRLASGEQTITPFLTDTLFHSLQGLTLSEDEQTLLRCRLPVWTAGHQFINQAGHSSALQSEN